MNPVGYIEVFCYKCDVIQGITNQLADVYPTPKLDNI